MSSIAAVLGVSIYLFTITVALVNDQANAEIDYGTFQNPSSQVRPKFRYWLPDASVDKATVSANIESAARVGAGGVQFLGFYNYGGELQSTPPGADWTTYGFGTPAFQSQFKNALQTSKDLGLVMDFPLGPNQGQGVPAEVNDSGLQWDLVPFSTSFTSNISGTVPGWGTGELVAAVYAQVLSETNVTLSPSTVFSASEGYYLRLVLRNDSLVDVTNEVSSSGHLSLKLPEAPEGSYYRLFTYFQQHTLHRNLIYTSGSETGTIFENGSFIVDHFSARGAQTTINFWETYMLNNGVKELLMDVGHCGWEDSIEILSNTSWSPDFPAMFEEKFGYSLLQFLPLVQWNNNNYGQQSSTSPGIYDCVLDTPDQGVGYVNDFRAILVHGYRQYLEAFTNWTNSMNLQYSAQVSYNLPMDMEANIPFVNVPECESLGFNNNIDGYRQFTGSAQLAGKRVISNEMDAEFGQAYQLTLPQLLWYTARAFITGVNQVVLHGQQYTGDYYDTTWPGYVAFSYLFSEQWSNKQPSWDHGFADTLDHIARMQFLLQQGTPKTDVALYNKQAVTNPSFATSLYVPADLLHEGWSYTYLSPDNFALPEAVVQNGVLAPNGPAYKVMVVNANYTNVTVDSISTLDSYAEAGLPVIFTSGTPSYYSAGSGSDNATFETALTALLGMKNVYIVGAGDVANQLNSLGLRPNVKVQANGTWYTSFRDDSENGMAYVSVYADLFTSNGTVEIVASGIPYFFNTWTGEQTPVITYTRSPGSITIPLNLVGNQTVFIAISNKALPHVDTPDFSILAMVSSVLGYCYSSRNGLTLHVGASSTAETIYFSTGESVTLESSTVATPFVLSNWTLVAEHWKAPFNLSDAKVVAEKYNTTHTLDTLTSWVNIPALVNASGVGYYTSVFSWPPSPAASERNDGAYIAFPPVLHTLRARVNGRSLPPIDLTDPRVDISKYLQSGTNTLEVIVPTVMWNYLRSIFGELVNAGDPPELETVLGLPPIVDNGLVGTVTIVPYRSVVVR